jgi:hypothetical protein
MPFAGKAFIRRLGNDITYPACAWHPAQHFTVNSNHVRVAFTVADLVTLADVSVERELRADSSQEAGCVAASMRGRESSLRTEDAADSATATLKQGHRAIAAVRCLTDHRGTRAWQQAGESLAIDEYQKLR